MIVFESRANTLHDAFNQIFRQNHLAVNLHQRIIKVEAPEGDGAVMRQGPRRGGPDNQRLGPLTPGRPNFAFTASDRRRGTPRRSTVTFCRNIQLPLPPARNGSQHAVHRLSAFVQMTVLIILPSARDDVQHRF